MKKDISSIAAHFALEGSVLDAAPYGAGHIHDTFRVRFSQSGSFILQRINVRVFRNPQAVMENIVRASARQAGVRARIRSVA
jgi:hypothetical protein